MAKYILMEKHITKETLRDLMLRYYAMHASEPMSVTIDWEYDGYVIYSNQSYSLSHWLLHNRCFWNDFLL